MLDKETVRAKYNAIFEIEFVETFDYVSISRISKVSVK